jgi:hypothetical protein
MKRSEDIALLAQILQPGEIMLNGKPHNSFQVVERMRKKEQETWKELCSAKCLSDFILDEGWADIPADKWREAVRELALSYRRMKG